MKADTSDADWGQQGTAREAGMGRRPGSSRDRFGRRAGSSYPVAKGYSLVYVHRVARKKLTGGGDEVSEPCSGAGESCRVAMGGGEGWVPGWCSYWARSSDL